MEALRLDVNEVRELVNSNEPGEKSGEKVVQVDSFKRLQEKVKSHGDLLTKLKSRDA